MQIKRKHQIPVNNRGNIIDSHIRPLMRGTVEVLEYEMMKIILQLFNICATLVRGQKRDVFIGIRERIASLADPHFHSQKGLFLLPHFVTGTYNLCILRQATKPHCAIQHGSIEISQN